MSDDVDRISKRESKSLEKLATQQWLMYNIADQGVST